jgi:hypothetical protein
MKTEVDLLDTIEGHHCAAATVDEDPVFKWGSGVGGFARENEGLTCYIEGERLELGV